MIDRFQNSIDQSKREVTNDNRGNTERFIRLCVLNNSRDGKGHIFSYAFARMFGWNKLKYGNYLFFFSSWQTAEYKKGAFCPFTLEWTPPVASNRIWNFYHRPHQSLWEMKIDLHVCFFNKLIFLFVVEIS